MRTISQHLSQCFIGFFIGYLCTFGAHANAADPLHEFQTDEQAALYLKLTKDHRCLKCQNQNLAGSSAGIAQDLKREIYLKVLDGESGPDISQYLVDRYGDFVLYKPSFKSNTMVLWIGPFLLLFLALGYAIRFSKQSQKSRKAPNSDELARARKLLDD